MSLYVSDCLLVDSNVCRQSLGKAAAAAMYIQSRSVSRSVRVSQSVGESQSVGLGLSVCKLDCEVVLECYS